MLQARMELWMDVPALSFDVTHCITMAENKTAQLAARKKTADQARYVLSQLQHMRHTQPGSPLRPIRTDRLLC